MIAETRDTRCAFLLPGGVRLTTVTRVEVGTTETPEGGQELLN
jgi:hypothetical protein